MPNNCNNLFSGLINCEKYTLGSSSEAYLNLTYCDRFEYMFNENRSLGYLNLANLDFNSSEVVKHRYEGMFQCCFNLKTIYVDSNNTFNRQEKNQKMFTDTYVLEGGNGSK